MMKGLITATACAVVVVSHNSPVAAQCDFDVLAYTPTPTPGFVYSMTTFDDGTGPVLVAGGDFYSSWSENVRRWNGRNWSPMGSASFYPGRFVVFNGELYCAAYGFKVAKWNGSDWVGFGDGLAYPPGDFAIFDDGSGNGTALYAAANDKLYRLATDTWTHVAMFDDMVYSLQVFDDGSGPVVYAGGAFTNVNGVEANKVARWDGTSWTALGQGIAGTVYDLAEHIHNGKKALFASGNITQAGAAIAHDAAVWDGQAWTALPPTGLAQPSINQQKSIGRMTVWNDGSGEKLYAVAVIESLSSGDAYANLIKWDGSSWLHLAGASYLAGSTIRGLHVHDDGTGVGPALFVGGKFVSLGGIEAGGLARVVPGGILPQPGTPDAAVGAIHAFANHDDGSGPALYVGGRVTTGTITASAVLRWNGSSWSTVGGGIHARGGAAGLVRTLASVDDGSGAGPALIAAGAFAVAGGQPANNIARWDGEQWTALGNGLTLSTPNSTVNALCVHDDGNGVMLYAGGDFTHAGGLVANHIARWDGQTWWNVGGGFNGPVYALEVFDDGLGAGPALYAGGDLPTPMAPSLRDLLDGMARLGPTSVIWAVDGWARCVSLMMASVIRPSMPRVSSAASQANQSRTSLTGMARVGRRLGSLWLPVSAVLLRCTSLTTGAGPHCTPRMDSTTSTVRSRAMSRAGMAPIGPPW